MTDSETFRIRANTAGEKAAGVVDTSAAISETWIFFKWVFKTFVAVMLRCNFSDLPVYRVEHAGEVAHDAAD